MIFDRDYIDEYLRGKQLLYKSNCFPLLTVIENQQTPNLIY